MTVITKKPISNSQRHLSYLDNSELSKAQPLKSLVHILKKHSGRNVSGRVTVRHQGGRQKRYYRIIDFKRDKRNVPGIVNAIEYDPNRTTNIALIHYTDGEKRYILAPQGLKRGDTILAGDQADFNLGNALPLKNIPLGMPIHNIELRVHKGGQIVRSAGASAIIQSKEGKYANVVLPSSEVRKILLDCYATIGQLSNADWQNVTFGKAGRKRLMGIRPAVRGSAMSPNSHPHGGGEGKAGVGMSSPKSPWGKKTMGKKTRQRKKHSDKWIVTRRKRK